MSIRNRLLLLPETESTNSYLLDRPELLKTPGLVVRSVRQTAGRGRRGKVWEGGEGNLYCSLVLDPSQYAIPQPSFTLLAGLALYRALENKGMRGHWIKWPNDILWQEKKLAGILTETKQTLYGQRLVLGLGVNLVGGPSQFSAEIATQSVTLEQAGMQVTAIQMLQAFLLAFGEILDAVKVSGLTPFLADWERCCQSLGRQIWHETSQGWAGAKIIGLASDGALKVVDVQGQVQVISGGEVRFAKPNP